MGALLTRLKELFSVKQMEVVLIGLENSGKTTFLHQLAIGEAIPTAPTIGLNVKQIKKGGLNLKVWDLGGQVQYRSEWGKYTKGCNAILFMIDAGNKEALPIAKRELQGLLEDSDINGVPLLVLGNKIDIKDHLTEKEIIEGMNLDYIDKNSWLVCMVSALKGTNVANAVDWLVKKSKEKK